MFRTPFEFHAPRGLSRALPTIGLWAAALAISPGMATAQSSTGAEAAAPSSVRPFNPLGLTERNPLYNLFYTPRMAPAHGLGLGQTDFAIELAYSNIFERSVTPTHRQLFDVERLTTMLAVQRGVTDRLDVGARVSVHSSWGGFLDGLIEGVHEAFNVSNGDRDLEPQGQNQVRLSERGGTVLFDAQPRSFAIADLQLFGQFRLKGSATSPTAVALRATAKLPSGAEGTTTGNVDGALELHLRRSGTAWGIHGLLGMTSLSAPQALEPLARDAAIFAGVAVERRVTPGLSVLVQAQGGSNYVSGIGEDELDDFPLIVGFGVSGGSEEWSWQAAFVEDIPPNGPSVDVTLHFQVTRRWK